MINSQKVQSMRAFRNLFGQQQAISESDKETYDNFHSYAFSPLTDKDEELDEKTFNEKATQIFQWAMKNGAKHYTFFAYPHTDGILEKQETFLDIQYFYDYTLKESGKSHFSKSHLGKAEGDGSSFPTGGLRQTQSARAYTVWDQKSQVFLRKKTGVLYIPSLLVSHYGQPLDDKTLFRKTQVKLERSARTLLKRLNRNPTAVRMALGLEQEVFIISSDAYEKRLDIKTTGRALIGKMPSKNQQFSDHYYGKLPRIIEEAFDAVEKELLEIGIPCKTRHKQVAPNQFEFCPLFEEAGKTIDHNMILMEILKETFHEKGLQVLLHEKPFANLNGSGKHCNWSLNYVDENGNLNNLFQIPKKKEDVLLFRLFVLIQLKALLKNGPLHLASVSPTGNELRLGGHEAPPRIISAFLGSTVSEILDNVEVHQRLNLRDELPNLNYDLNQEDTDRNRTSPYAYTGNKFEFRAAGSSQNVSFIMSVIGATIAKEIDAVNERLDKGEKIEDIMESLLKETKPVRFSGNGYSPEWVEEAKKRGLYVNEKFYENYENFKEAGKIFVELGLYKEKELEARYNTMASLYENTVKAESDCLQSIIGSEIVPRCYEFLKLVDHESKSKRINERSSKFVDLFDELLGKEESLKKNHEKAESLENMAALRQQVFEVSEHINKILYQLPKNKEWPEFEDFIHKY